MLPKILCFVSLTSILLTSPLFSQIEAGQSVLIKIMGVVSDEKAKIDDTYPVSKNGKVNLPYIGEIQAAGLNSEELAKSIQNAYRNGDIFNDATIQVISKQNEIQLVAQRVHINGQVKERGPRAYAIGLTVYQAVQAAGGATELGAMNRVILWRNGKQQKIDLRTTEGKGVIVMPGDTIEVPPTNSIGKYILYIALAIIAAFWTLAKFRRHHRLINRICFL